VEYRVLVPRWQLRILQGPEGKQEVRAPADAFSVNDHTAAPPPRLARLC
jgi:hypothetical protein